jgi:hypothetical protein
VWVGGSQPTTAAVKAAALHGAAGNKYEGGGDGLADGDGPVEAESAQTLLSAVLTLDGPETPLKNCRA